VGIDENAEPDKQQRIVYADTPKKHFLDLIRSHGIAIFWG
jgi:hypothetical protein